MRYQINIEIDNNNAAYDDDDYNTALSNDVFRALSRALHPVCVDSCDYVSVMDSNGNAIGRVEVFKIPNKSKGLPIDRSRRATP